MAGRNWTRKSIEELVDGYLRQHGGSGGGGGIPTEHTLGITAVKTYSNAHASNYSGKLWLVNRCDFYNEAYYKTPWKHNYSEKEEAIYYDYLSQTLDYFLTFLYNSTSLYDMIKKSAFTTNTRVNSAQLRNFFLIASDKVYRFVPTGLSYQVCRVSGSLYNVTVDSDRTGISCVVYASDLDYGWRRLSDAITNSGKTGTIFICSAEYTDDEIKANYGLDVETINY